MNGWKPRRLSALQSLMREWSALAPYNFIHVLRFETTPDIDRWQSAVTAAMRELSISTQPFAVEQPAADLETHLEAELQRPFAPGDPPFRFFVVSQDDAGYWFGVVIDHWAADDFSCRLLLSRICSGYNRQNDATHSLGLATKIRRTALGFRAWTLYLKEALRMRRACRTSFTDPTDFTVRVFRRVLPEEVVKATRALGQQHGATVNDVLLAAAAQTFSAGRRWQPTDKRDSVAIVSAMDLRRFEPEATRDRVGLFLNFFTVMAGRPHEFSLPEAIQQVATQTIRAKARPETELFGPLLFLWRLTRSKRAKATFFTRGAPFVAGLSNVNLTGTWVEDSNVKGYRRIGPTGPVIPMVLMITTFRGCMSIDVTFRTTAFVPGEAERLLDDILRRLPGKDSKPRGLIG